MSFVNNLFVRLRQCLDVIVGTELTVTPFIVLPDDYTTPQSHNIAELLISGLFVLFRFYITFNDLSVISRQCLDVAGSSMFTSEVLPH